MSNVIHDTPTDHGPDAPAGGSAAVLTGRASRGIGSALTRHGYRLIVPPESFLVTKLNTLVDGESSRARRWGEALAAETTLTAGLGSRG
jgi:hypothetical protein